MESCPKELEPYDLAHKRKMMEMDSFMHMWWGVYGVNAVSVAVEHCLAGKKAKSEFIKESVLEKIYENDGLTQEEIDERELRKMLLAEEMWIKNDKKRGLKDTITKQQEQ